MTLTETPNLGILWCPGCAPERDPTREILETHWCYRHGPTLAGVDDRPSLDGPVRIGNGSGPADGDDCRAFAALMASGH